MDNEEKEGIDWWREKEPDVARRLISLQSKTTDHEQKGRDLKYLVRRFLGDLDPK